MTENEVIEVLSNFDKQAHAKADGAYQTNAGATACKLAIKALEEIQQYRAIGTPDDFKAYKSLGSIESIIETQLFAEVANDELQKYKAIGTVEECREAVEKQKAKKPNRCVGFESLFRCPTCGRKQTIMYEQYHCKECGQKLDWGEEE